MAGDARRASPDGQRVDLPAERKAPGWLHGLTLVVLPLVLWILIFRAPLLFLAIVALMAATIYGLSDRQAPLRNALGLGAARWRKTARHRVCSQQEDPADPVRVAAGEDCQPAASLPCAPALEADRPSAWVAVVVVMAFLFWLGIGAFALWYLVAEVRW
ncbi:hypothetical protein [Sphingobium aquiterrae]|uniref:hypothetical protein n=1 Tax=Sphingobium aquiterrae TaxID=2038656 RepID=UPI003015A1A1